MRASFSNVETGGAKNRRNPTLMTEPFLSFSKAYFLHDQAISPNKNFFSVLSALRVLEKVLMDTYEASDVYRLSPAICALAAANLKERYPNSTAYAFGLKLNAIIALVSELQLAPPFQWISPLPKSFSRAGRIGKEADELREKRLPSSAALFALPKCFLLAEDYRDVLVTSVVAILCSTPDRIGELLNLPLDCEVRDSHNGKEIYGLRWWPQKGADPMVKWVAPTMVDVVQEAISRLKRISQPARDVALWYEAHPNEMYLQSRHAHLRQKEYIEMRDVVEIMGYSSVDSARTMMKNCKIEYFSKSKRSGEFYLKFRDLESYVIETGIKKYALAHSRGGVSYSKKLLICRMHEFKKSKPPSTCFVEEVAMQQIYQGLGAAYEEGVESVFSTFGFTEPDGSHIRVNSHAFRHYLNTLAQRGGLSELDIALWSGRKDIAQNSVYDQRSSDELVSLARSVVPIDSSVFGGSLENKTHLPVSYDDFVKMKYPTVHATEIGFCVHDFTMIPCQIHRDCLNCREHVCVKGDEVKAKRLQRQLDIAEEQLAKALEEEGEGTFGAGRWIEHHKTTVTRLRQLVAIMIDPDIPEGTLVHASPTVQHSPINMAVHDRLEKYSPDDPRELDLFLRLRSLT